MLPPGFGRTGAGEEGLPCTEIGGLPARKVPIAASDSSNFISTGRTTGTAVLPILAGV